MHASTYILQPPAGAARHALCDAPPLRVTPPPNTNQTQQKLCRRCRTCHPQTDSSGVRLASLSSSFYSSTSSLFWGHGLGGCKTPKNGAQKRQRTRRESAARPVIRPPAKSREIPLFLKKAEPQKQTHFSVYCAFTFFRFWSHATKSLVCPPRLSLLFQACCLRLLLPLLASASAAASAARCPSVRTTCTARCTFAWLHTTSASRSLVHF